MNTPKDGEGNMDSQDQSQAGGGVAALRLRKWDEFRGTVTIELTRKADDADMRLLNRAMAVFSGALERPDLYDAARDLLEACRAMVRMYEGDSAPGDLTPITSARAAISAALGQ